MYNEKSENIIFDGAIINQFGLQIKIDGSLNSFEQLQRRRKLLDDFAKDDESNKKFLRKDKRTEEEKDNEWENSNQW